MDSLVTNIFLKQIILIYILQTLIILSLFKISTLLVSLMSQNLSQNIIAWQLIRTSNWIRPVFKILMILALLILAKLSQKCQVMHEKDSSAIPMPG